MEKATPRYSGVIVDEGQDLSAVAVRLLYELDASPEHRNFMLIADAQQAIYPGGFSLRALGIEVRGRSTVLTREWRSTVQVRQACRALVAGQTFEDLDEGELIEAAHGEQTSKSDQRTGPYPSCTRSADPMT